MYNAKKGFQQYIYKSCRERCNSLNKQNKFDIILKYKHEASKI